ncbi:choline-binding transcriptional repressor BetI [Mangrovicoccus algicola]|uniref:HTH-type transcriptional regulator BetI n=1 Tax=Mangrovicoccus algicola TaxID=2771008 RepID=A0A8J6ZEX3_9RHOB|nr:transcriptional regulator BetI [Mangrovicoccus algicola]MBE3640250.1 transcriptional regulator BetI [Mangrovicoccus algicola]
MPKLGMEPIRRAALVQAAIKEIGAAGTLDVPVSRIARRAGMSPALAHHYFGSKEDMFLAAMRHILGQYGAEVRRALAVARGHRARLEAIISAGFTPANFARETVSAWLSFYVLAQTSPEANRLLRVYHRRLHSNLIHDLRPLAGGAAEGIAERLAGLVDGLYLHAALNPLTTAAIATGHALKALDNELRTA